MILGEIIWIATVFGASFMKHLNQQELVYSPKLSQVHPEAQDRIRFYDSILPERFQCVVHSRLRSDSKEDGAFIVNGPMSDLTKNTDQVSGGGQVEFPRFVTANRPHPRPRRKFLGDAQHLRLELIESEATTEKIEFSSLHEGEHLQYRTAGQLDRNTSHFIDITNRTLNPSSYRHPSKILFQIRYSLL